MKNFKIDKAPEQSDLRFGAGNPNHEVLRLEQNGHIVWTLNGEEIVIKDKKLLCIALLDLVNNLTKGIYDLSKIDKKLWEEYKEFLETAKK